MTAAEQVAPYYGYTVLPGHNSVFETRSGRTGIRWDGSYVDVLLHEAGINTVSFTNPSNALAVLTREGKIRKRNRYQIGDVVFLAENNYVGIVTGIDDKLHAIASVGWWPGVQGKRMVSLLRLNVEIDVLAFADPVLPIRQRYATRAVDLHEREQIAGLLHEHPAVGVYAAGGDFAHAYARWQRYCGYGPDKANGIPDAKSLERLCREERGKP